MIFAAGEGTCVILLFHSVDSRDLMSLRNLGNVSPELFERCLKTLKNEFDVVSLSQALEWMKNNRGQKERLLSVTFDDGPKSYSASALPILQSHDMPSACFLITDCVGDRIPYWRYQYNYAFNRGFGKVLAGLVSEEYGADVSEESVMSFTRKNYSREKTRRIMEATDHEIRAAGYPEREQDLFLSNDDLAGLKENPLVTLGIHTRSHPVLSCLADGEIREEIAESLKFYRENVSGDAPPFSAPFGRLFRDYDERTVGAARALGIEYVFSAYGGSNGKGQRACNIRRIPVSEEMIAGGSGDFLRMINARCRADEYEEAERRLYGADVC